MTDVRRGLRAALDPEPLTVEPPLLGVAVLLASVLWVFYGVVNVVGGVGWFLLAIAFTVAVAIGVARVIAPKVGLWIGIGLLAIGVTVYVLAVPSSQRALFTLPRLVVDTVSLLTGLSVLRLAEPTAWVLSMAPVPTFLAVYAGLRGRYEAAVAAAGGALGFFVLTGDAGAVVTLAGALGGATALGLDTLSAPGGYETQWRSLGVVLLAMLILSGTLTAVPGGATEPLVADRGSTGLESTLAAENDDLTVVGSIRLSQQVRFTIRSDEPARWRTGIYDEYTGDGWRRTGETRAYDGELSGPPGPSERITQEVTAEGDLASFPAAATPVAVDGTPAQHARVTELGGVFPAAPLREGETATVESERLRSEPAELRDAGTDYPDRIEERYTGLPESTPDRVGELTAEVIRDADADNPYDAALAIETYLERNKRYSLSVERPSGDVADAFLFEMDAGYCTYYATTMVAMLRSQDVPARLVTGYTTGEQIGENEWAVRGQNAHAWVEMYVPEHGWVTFDPTPSAPRDQVRDARLAEARQLDSEGVDVERSGPEEWSPEREEIPETETADVDQGSDGTQEGDVLDPQNGSGPNPGATGVEPVSGVDQRGFEGLEGRGEAPETGEERRLPSRDAVGYGILLLFGAAFGAHRSGWTGRAYRSARIQFQGRRRDPPTDVERAFLRLEYHLGRRYRPRKRNETPRAYLTAMRIRGADDRIEGVFEAYERARYGGEISRREADAAIETVDRLVRKSTPILGRFR
ncbi:MAG: transglutaminase domain-containing protein [Haloferacaceae archaeon]